MFKTFIAIATLFIAAQASAGTALVLPSNSGLNLIYPAADYAGDTDPLPYDVAICDNDFNNCLDFTETTTNPEAQVKLYEAESCKISLTRVNEKHRVVQTVKILGQTEGCVMANNKDQSIQQDFIFEFAD